MSREYYPDKWVLICSASDEDACYKILSTFFSPKGLMPDSWKISSGIIEESLIEQDDAFISPQFSKSVYILKKDNYGLTDLTRDVIIRYNVAYTSQQALVLTKEEAMRGLQRMTSKDCGVWKRKLPGLSNEEAKNILHRLYPGDGK